MSRYSVSPDLLFDRPWRAGHPFRPHTGRLRRRCIALLLIVLCLIIGAYGYLTDSARVRAMAQSYLSGLIGGRVEVGAARLSIFEGLRLENVTVYVDEDGRAPDSVLFSAQTITVLYDPRAMLAGRLEATQIIAEKPRVMLTVDAANNSWNYARLARMRNRRPAIVPSREGGNFLPEVLLRNARLSMSELREGRIVERGSMAIDGQLLPSADGDRYSFELQSRGSEGIGPYVSGSVNYLTGGLDAHLRNFEFGQEGDFGHDVLAMLPAAVRGWWERHQLAGRLDIPVVRYEPGSNGAAPGFRVETDLDGVTLTVGPEEWGGPLAGSAAESQPAKPRVKAISLRQVAGVLVFTESGIDVTDVSGRVENNAIRVSGRIDGYGPTAPMKLRITSRDTENIYIPASPRYVDVLPLAVREFYKNLRPQGACAIDVQLERLAEGGPPVVRGRVDVINGQFALAQFPYPLRESAGHITFGPEGPDGQLMVHIVDLRGRGVGNGPNRDGHVTIEGTIGPLAADSDPAVDVRVSGNGISSEETLCEAFPPPVRAALRMLSANGPEYPSYFGDFVCRIHRPPGKNVHWSFDTDIALDDASGALVGFAYPMRHVHGNIKVRDGYLDVENVESRQGDASVKVDGRVAWGTSIDDQGKVVSVVTDKPLQTKLRVRIAHLPIDEQLLAAMPPQRRQWLRKLGIKGTVNVDGVVWQPPVTGLPTPAATTQPGIDDDSLNYDFKITLAGGEVEPAGSKFVVSDVAGTMRLTPDALHIDSISGRRGTAQVGLAGDVSWADGDPQFSLQGQAVGLDLDQPLYDLLPASARSGWDQLRPKGTIDADVTYQSPERPAVAVFPQTQPAPEPKVRVMLQPRELSINPVNLPYRFDRLKGAVAIEGEHLVVTGLTARHGDATFALAGTGEMGPRSIYDLQLSAGNVMIDRGLRDALPTSLQNIVSGLKLHGPCDFRFTKLAYRGGAATTRPADPDAVVPPGDAQKIDLAMALTLKGGDLDVGVPLDHVNGQIKLDAQVLDGTLTAIHGAIDIDSLSMAGRTLHNFSADLLRTSDGDGLQLARMQAELANGQMAGEVDISFPRDQPSRYALSLVVRNADVRQLAQETDPSIQGDLTASLSLEGAWGDPSSRRGRGDVLVTGKEMYRLPLILGLLQVTNLALPIAQPFHRGTARYSLDGQRVNFDSIELRSDSMLMNGTGHLDFGTKQVRMTFVTDNPSSLQVPFLNDLIKGARNELLRINVKGTITQPKVETSVMGTFTTTVDQVLKGDDGK